MGLVKGGFQRLLQTVLYFILFLCCAVILGNYSYFLSVLADRNIHIPTWEKAVEGISGAACLYLIFATLLTCCLGGITGLAIIAIILDVAFAAGMIAVIVLTRHGASSCKGQVNTPLGIGPASSDNGFGKGGFGFGSDGNVTNSVHLGLACKLNTACFACAIIAAILFLCTAGMQVSLMRHHKKEKRLGPSPDNDYTSGYGNKKKSRFAFGRKNKNVDAAKTVEARSYTSPNNNRLSAEPGYTNGTNGYADASKTEHYAGGAHTSGAHSGYYTAPTGTAASNPYGYNNTTTTSTANY